MHYTATLQCPLQSTLFTIGKACWPADNVEILLVEQMSHAQPAQVNLPQKPAQHQSITQITVLPGFESDSDRWHTSLFTNPIDAWELNPDINPQLSCRSSNRPQGQGLGSK
jgi:hypothetical protein